MKTTVTPDASVASGSSSIEEALESGFLPTDREYRKTGRFAEDSGSGSRSTKEEHEVEQEDEERDQETEVEQDQETDATSGEKDGEIAAASQAAEQQNEKEETTEHRQTRTPQKAESRWAKLSRENRELKEKLAQAAKSSAPTTRDTTQASQPAAETKSKAEPRPKIDDVDPKTGQPKYASFADYEAARDEWLQTESVRKFQETQAKTDRERQQAQAKEMVVRSWNEKVTSARTKHADFDKVALNPQLPLKEGTVADVFILESPQGPDVLYYLGQNPQELERINGLNPIAQARELTKIELKLAGNSSGSSAKPVTQAPRPPHQVSGKGTVAKDAVEQAIEEQDAEAYRREQNARDPRLRSVRSRK